MAYSYEQYLQDSSATAKTGSRPADKKVGFFKLAKSGDAALVRINISQISEFMMTSYHQFGEALKYQKVECLNPHRNGSKCPICDAVKKGFAGASASRSRIFIPMMVIYQNGEQNSTPTAVIWDAPANPKQDYAKAIATKLKDFGDLREHVFVLRRNGDGLNTSYSLDYVPQFDKEAILAKDFSAFDGFRIDKHSYFVKSAEDMEYCIENGTFPPYVAPEAQTQEQPAQTTSTEPEKITTETFAPNVTVPEGLMGTTTDSPFAKTSPYSF